MIETTIVLFCVALSVVAVWGVRRKPDLPAPVVACAATGSGGAAGMAAPLLLAATQPAMTTLHALTIALSVAALAAPIAWAIIRRRSFTFTRPAWSGMGRPPGRTSDVRMFRRRRRRRSVRTYQEVKP